MQIYDSRKNIADLYWNLSEAKMKESWYYLDATPITDAVCV